MNDRIDILGVRIDRYGYDDAVSKINEYINEDKTHICVTPNPYIVLKARKSRELMDAINCADIVLADGIGIIYASRLVNSPLKERVCGVDVGEHAISYCAERGISVYFLGGKEGVGENAALKLVQKYKGLKIAGYHNGYFDDDSEVIEKINDSGAQVLFVCLGCPRQELFAHINKDRLSNISLMLCLGGALDVYSGKVRRAPVIFRKLNLEWFWRCIVSPKKIFSVFNIPKFIYFVLKDRRKNENKP